MTFIVKPFNLLGLVLSCGFLTQCSAKGDGAGTTNPTLQTGTPTPRGSVAVANEWAKAFPTGVALASPVASLTPKEEDRLPDSISLPFRAAIAEKIYPQSLAGKVDFFMERLDGTSERDCLAAIPEMNFTAEPVACFGPELTYSNHPDNGTSGAFAVGQLGAFFTDAATTNSTGKACMAHKLDAAFGHDARFVDLGFGLQAALFCLAKQRGIPMPEVGKSVDFIASIPDVNFKQVGISLREATLTQDTNIHYSIKLSGELHVSNPASVRDFSITAAIDRTDNSNIAGLLSWSILDYMDDVTNQEWDRAGTFKYSVVNNAATVRLRQADYVPNTPPAFLVNGELDPEPANLAPGAPLRCNGGGWCANYHEILTQLDDDGDGIAVYSWLPKASRDQAYVFNIDKTDTDPVQVYFGITENNVIGTDRLWDIAGFACVPKEATTFSSAGRLSNAVQMQELTYNKAERFWVAKKNYISYVPTQSCAWNTTIDSRRTAQFAVSVLNAETGQKEAKALAFPTNPSLFPFTDYRQKWHDELTPPQ